MQEQDEKSSKEFLGFALLQVSIIMSFLFGFIFLFTGSDYVGVKKELDILARIIGILLLSLGVIGSVWFLKNSERFDKYRGECNP